MREDIPALTPPSEMLSAVSHPGSHSRLAEAGGPGGLGGFGGFTRLKALPPPSALSTTDKAVGKGFQAPAPSGFSKLVPLRPSPLAPAARPAEGLAAPPSRPASLGLGEAFAAGRAWS